MKSRIILLAASLLLIGCGNSTNEGQSEKPEDLPNVILIVGDDHGYPYFGFMGADYVSTPNMDQLAESGVLFTNGYVPDNHCRPSLQTLMTGTLPVQYWQQAERIMEEEMDEEYKRLEPEKQQEWQRDFRFQAMSRFETLPKLLGKKGYRSFQGGKWWEFNYQNGGFTDGMTKGWSKEDEKDAGWFQQFMGGEGTELARATMQPVYDFIDEHHEHPMFIWYAPELPHYPFDAPDKYYSIYKDEEMTESAKRYYANCTWFDDGIGALMNYLSEKGELDNTLFVYVNDNGWEQAPHQEFRHDSLRWHNGGDKGKLSIYDQSFRTPIIFSWKGQIPTGGRRSDLIHSADIPATVLDYAGISVPEDYFGMSFRSVIEGTGEGLRDQVAGNVTQIRWEGDMMGKNIEGYWLRTDDWFLQWNVTDDQQLLFDMGNDPNNDHDLAASRPEVVQQLSTYLMDYKQRFALGEGVD